MTRNDAVRVAGYRVVRLLGSGRRAEVHLGHAGDQPGGDADRTVALKVFGAAAAASSGTDVAVISAVHAVCMPVLHDVATLRDGGICLVLERLDGPTLSGWLASERRPHPGELVTVLGAVIASVAAARAAGWALGELVPSAIRFSRSGRPVITSFSGARAIATTDAGDEVAATSAPASADELRLELRQLGDFIADVLALARHSDPGFLAWLRQQETVRPFTDRLPELEARVFDWAPARAVGIDAEGARTSPAAVPGRLAPAEGMHPGSDGSVLPPDNDNEYGDGDGDHGGRMARLQRAVRGTARMLSPSRLRDLLLGFLARHRRPAILAGLVVVVGAGAVLSLVPPAAQGAASGSDSAAGASARPADTQRPTAAAAGPGRTAQPAVEPADPAIAADDPVAAAIALLEARDSCLMARSVSCLDGVDQAGSPLDDADRHALSGGRDPRSLPVVPGIALVGRSGDAVVVTVPSATPEMPAASLLLMKGEAGWRLREVFEG